MVLTSLDKLGETGQKTGFELEELAAPDFVFIEAGADITLAFPLGGQLSQDPNSDTADAQKDDSRRLNTTAEVTAALAAPTAVQRSRRSRADQQA